MLSALIKWLTGGGVDAISKAYAARHNAQTEQQRIDAEIEINRVETQQANRELGGRVTAWVQLAWAAPFIAYNSKLIVWDKMLGMGATDALSGDLMDLQLRIVTFYFGGSAAVGVVRALRNR